MTMETPMPLNFRPHWQHFTPTSIHDHDLFGSLDCSQAQVVSHDLSASHHLWLQNMWQNGSQHATTGGCPGIFSASMLHYACCESIEGGGQGTSGLPTHGSADGQLCDPFFCPKPSLIPIIETKSKSHEVITHDGSMYVCHIHGFCHLPSI